MTMASTTTRFTEPRAAAVSGARTVARIRDPRLDFYRGIAMFIILASHTPRNFLSLWIPARWGFSDATEIFVFCSGMASAIAFGSSYDRRGWLLGTARVAQRVWQVYWAHIGMFIFAAAMLAAIDYYGGFDKNYIGSLNLWRLFDDPSLPLIGLFTLTYVPNYFDVLPMYMAILVMMPAVMAVARYDLRVLAGALALIWLLAQSALWDYSSFAFEGLNFPAEPWSDRHWFFNPFGWQVVFFTGFAFIRGWIPAPPIRIWLIALAAAVLIVNIPLSSIGVRELGLDWAKDWRSAYNGWFDKSDLGVLRYVHFLALAYIAWVIAGPHGSRLRPDGEGIATRAFVLVVRLTTKVGQQSLAVFLFSMVFAQFSGFVMDQVGRNVWNMTLANLFGFALLIGVAYCVSWFKSQPWKGSATG